MWKDLTTLLSNLAQNGLDSFSSVPLIPLKLLPWYNIAMEKYEKVRLISTLLLQSNEEPITNGGTTSDVKGKGKGKGKGKSSSVVKQAKDGEDGVTETPPPSPPSASKKTSPKKSAEELYKGLLSDEPEDEMDSEDEEDGAFGNSDDDDTEDTEDEEAEDVEDESDSVDDDDEEEDGFMCGPGRDYAEMVSLYVFICTKFISQICKQYVLYFLLPQLSQFTFFLCAASDFKK